MNLGLVFGERITATVRIKIPDWLDRILTWPLLFYRRLRYGDPFRRIYLGDGIFALVSPHDYYPLTRFNWYLASNGQQFYAFTNIKIGPGKIRMVSMHRMIMNAPRHLIVDHKDNNTLDNRRPNLRFATHAQNAFNRQKVRTKTCSKYIGVYFEKRTGRWTVKIRIGSKRLWLGRFTSELAAARAYDAAARKYHKEFAVLNFPD